MALWNQRALEPSPEELVEEALGDAAAPRARPQVALGQSVVAVNDVFADVGLMQQQLLSKSQAR